MPDTPSGDDPADQPERFGPNTWLVEEMFDRFRSDPEAVSEAWQDFLADYRTAGPPQAGARPAAAAGAAPPRRPPTLASPVPSTGVPATTAPSSAPGAPAIVAAAPVSDEGEPLRGTSAAIVTNMERSLGMPTATGVRVVPAKLLEVNRSVINGYLGRSGAGKVSFTHLIAYAVVRAIADDVPGMNATYAVGSDGKPRIVHHEHVNVGLAVDMAKPDGSRTLVVPVVKQAEALDFATFIAAYEDLIRRARTGKLTIDDFQGATLSITNPGMIGTVMSVPRLMAGQAVIVGVGSIGYPAEWQGADERALAELGVSKVVTLTSTYDHRVIQGAESGQFLRRVHERLLGEHGFYHDVFRSLDVPYEDVRWHRDVSPINREDALLDKQLQVATMIRAYRVRGHLIADLDPLRWKEPSMPEELDPAHYGLTIWDLDREFMTGGVAGQDRMRLGDLLHVLRDAYCRTLGVEYMHIQHAEEQRWIQTRVEGVATTLTSDEQRHVLERLNAAEAFERFLATKYVGTKRFGLEGAESAIVILDTLLTQAADVALDGVAIGMAHRGRLNVLANIVGKSYEQIFKEFEGYVDPSSVQGSGDVKYHVGASGKFVSVAGADVKVEVAANPSHLEAVDPVVVGLVRARQDQIDPPGSYPWMSVLIHGDAAFAGQGVVAETLAMSDITGYRIGGTIHLVINNQIGFTTSPEFARSSPYPTDVAKAVQAPIIHVNGDDPEACVRAARLAFEYRRTFRKDVVIDMVCYRRHGHNEGDDPSYTQPLMYKAIEQHRSVRKLYVESLVRRGELTLEEAEAVLADYQQKLQVALDETRSTAAAPVQAGKPKIVGVLPAVETGVPRETLDRIFAHLTEYPDGFTVHPKLARQFDARSRAYAEGGDVDWATGEALAIGSLLLEGHDVRLAGQDTQRGTFSQRHAVLVDYEDEARWTPLNSLADQQGRFRVYNSLLSEYAAVGFEYGYSIGNPEALVAWEGQFGDFVNGAQIVVDQFIVAAEDKWGQASGVVLLLPHGYEGQGPEHSSGRLERFLTLAAEDNIQVCYPTTAAQYFHLLRRQLHRAVRKPLIVFTPKKPLRMAESRSAIDALVEGHFHEVLDDPAVADRSAVKRLCFASGKVVWDLMVERERQEAPVAVVRVEQLYPFPEQQLVEVLQRYPEVTDLVWVQEEPENMGAWAYVEHRTHPLRARGYEIRCVARVESGSPASGSGTVHDQEQAELMESALAGW